MRTKLLAIITSIETYPLTLGIWVLTFTSIVSVRLGIEHFFNNFEPQLPAYYFYQFAHHFFTFLCIFLVMLVAIHWFAQVTLKEAANVLTFGFLLIWLPPIVDEIMSHGKGLWSYYTFDSLSGLWQRYLTFFGDRPDMGITYGIRVEIAIAIIALGCYAYFKSNQIFRGILTTVGIYTLFFILGALPSILTLMLLGWEKGFFAVTGGDVAALILSPSALFGFAPPNPLSSLSIKMSLVFASLDILLVDLILFFGFRSYFVARWKNARIPQITYHVGLFLLGAILSVFYTGGDFAFDIFHGLGLFIMLSSIILAWLSSVVINDLYDQKIDILTNPSRPIQTGSIPLPLYRTWGVLFFLASIFLMALISTAAALLLCVYQCLSWIYSAPPLRLKRFPIIATGLAASASVMILFAGFIVFSGEKNITALPWQIPAFLFVAYTMLLPIKDLKDIVGDRADGVLTLPVLLGETWTKRLLGGILFLLFVSSVFFLHINSLFWLAFFFGTIGYWILQLSSNTSRTFHYRKLAGWIVVLVFFYGLFLFISLASGK